jgi:hypothetical protein
MRISKEELLKHVRGCLRNPIILVFDEKGGPPLEKGVFVGNCAREKKKKKEKEKGEQARKGMAN